MEQFLEMITTYGAPFVITAIVLYGAFRVMNILIAKFENTHKKTKEQQQHEALLEVRKNIDKTVNLSLERVLMRTGADRAFIFEFHNGGSNLGGLPFLKMSNTYEVVDTGIIPQRMHLENMSTSMYYALLSQIIEKDHLVIYTNIVEEGIPQIAYETLKFQKIHTTVLVRISDVKGRVVGYTGIDFVREEKQLQGNSHIQQVKALALEIGALLSVDD